MELSHADGKLKVHYSERLVTLIREVRQLAALGFNIPGKIQSTADVANKFYRHGVILKQVWHVWYFNSVSKSSQEKYDAIDSCVALTIYAFLPAHIEIMHYF